MVNFLEELQTDIHMVQKMNYKDMIWYTSWTQIKIKLKHNTKFDPMP